LKGSSVLLLSYIALSYVTYRQIFVCLITLIKFNFTLNKSKETSTTTFSISVVQRYDKLK